MHKETGRITTLGRGGSDTSAVAIAAAIGADRCDIYTDVDGVYTTDPRVVPQAHRMDKIAYEEMLELASLGAKVMQVRSVELGMVHNVRIFVRSSFDKPEDIDPQEAALRHTHLRRGGDRGTAGRHRHRLFQGRGADFDPPRAGQAGRRRRHLRAARRCQHQRGYDRAERFGDGATTDLTFTVPSADYERARVTLDKAKGAIGFERLDGATDVSKVSRRRGRDRLAARRRRPPGGVVDVDAHHGDGVEAASSRPQITISLHESGYTASPVPASRPTRGERRGRKRGERRAAAGDLAGAFHAVVEPAWSGG